MSKTKTFSNGWGSKDLTRDEYIKHWLEATHQFTTIFYGIDEGITLISFQGDLVEAAGKYWDNYKPMLVKVEE